MDRIAIISDIHGNIPALEAVLADIRQRGIPRIYCLGDLVGKGPDSAAVVDVCRDICDVVVQGNWDNEITIERASDAWQWHRNQLGEERLTYLRTLPYAVDLLLSGRRVRLFHASAKGIYHRVTFRSAFTELREMFRNTERTGFAHPPPDIVGYGDIHHPYLLPVDNRTLFNVGSVGNPLDGIALAGYAILQGKLEGTKQAHWSIEIVRVSYDIEQALALAQAVAMPQYAEYAFELQMADHRSQMQQGQYE